MDAKETKDWWVQCTPALLTIAGIDHEVFNNGQHIVIMHEGTRYEAWPSSGMWVCLQDPKKPAVRSNVRMQGQGIRKQLEARLWDTIKRHTSLFNQSEAVELPQFADVLPRSNITTYP